MAEAKAHQRVRTKVAGKKGKTKKKLKYGGRFDASTPKKDFEYDRGGTTESLTRAVRKLKRSKNSESSPSWSPDGQFIVFTRESKNLRYSHIYVTKADGKGELRQLISGKNYKFSPSWSSTGSFIAHLRIDDKYLDLDEEKMEKVSVNKICLKKIF